jgi:putative oxidoreductase
VIVGYYARFGAALLAIFLVLATYYFHAFWKLPAETPEQVQAKTMMTIEFMKNLSMFGAMLFIVANGAGRASLDAKWHAKSPA